MFKNFWDVIEKLARAVFKAFFSLICREYTNQIDISLMQFVRFGVVGVSNTILSYVIYATALLILNNTIKFEKYEYLVAHIITFVLSVLWSYYWNKKKVFKADEGKQYNTFRTILKSYATYAITGLFLSSALLYLWIDVIGISEFIAPIINLFITVPVNFVLNKFWTFK